ncbi:MAG: hypothetical protein ACI8PT_000158 [Gammaproteobacteria bacterium]|jgi:hypothetical protein
MTQSTIAAALLILALGHIPDAFADPNSAGRCNIVRATENPIWRLDKETSEVAVCTLDAEHLVCISSEQAAVPPRRSYAQLETDRAEVAREQALAREEKRKRQLAIFNRMLHLFQEFSATGGGE